MPNQYLLTKHIGRSNFYPSCYVKCRWTVAVIGVSGNQLNFSMHICREFSSQTRRGTEEKSCAGCTYVLTTKKFSVHTAIRSNLTKQKKHPENNQTFKSMNTSLIISTSASQDLKLHLKDLQQGPFSLCEFRRERSVTETPTPEYRSPSRSWCSKRFFSCSHWALYSELNVLAVFIVSYCRIYLKRSC